MIYKKYFKRPLDIIMAVVGLFIFSPLILIITFVLAISYKGTPFFTQKRPGKNEKIFSVFKFKTMNDKTDIDGNLLPDTDRLTSIGRFIRKTSLDELPQLINILKGEMSLIGPRPLLIRYLPHYTPEERLRFEVRPGITGLAQISGRNFLSWEEKFKKDVTYVSSISFINDAKIFWTTVIKVIKGDDIEVDQSTTEMEAMDTLRIRLSKSN